MFFTNYEKLIIKILWRTLYYTNYEINPSILILRDFFSYYVLKKNFYFTRSELAMSSLKIKPLQIHCMI